MVKKDNLDITKITDTYSKAETEKSKADDMLRDLRNKIWHGETTGDKITDFVIVHHGQISKEKEKPYRDLEHTINNNINEPIIIVVQSEGIAGCPGVTSPEYIEPVFLQITTKYKFGIIKSKMELDLKFYNIIIPMDKHLECTTKYNQNEWRESDGSIIIEFNDFKHLNKSVRQRHKPKANDSSDEFQRGMHIYVKDDALLYLQGAFYNLPMNTVEDIYGGVRPKDMKILNEQALEWMKK